MEVLEAGDVAGDLKEGQGVAEDEDEAGLPVRRLPPPLTRV